MEPIVVVAVESGEDRWQVNPEAVRKWKEKRRRRQYTKDDH
jgi:hypothetical protein